MTIRARQPSASICLPAHGIVGIGPRHHVCVLCSVLLHYFRDCYFVSSSFGLPPQRKMGIERDSPRRLLDTCFKSAVKLYSLNWLTRTARTDSDVWYDCEDRCVGFMIADGGRFFW